MSLFGSAQSLLAGLAALGRTRLELFSAELEEEIARQAGALLGAVGEEYRLAASIGVAALFFVLALAAGWSLRRLVRSKPRAFDASISQLERDCSAQRAALLDAASPIVRGLSALDGALAAVRWAARAHAVYSLLRRG